MVLYSAGDRVSQSQYGTGTVTVRPPHVRNPSRPARSARDNRTAQASQDPSPYREGQVIAATHALFSCK